MTHRTQLVCAFVEPQPIGKHFSVARWPLHATIVPWFQLKSPVDEFNKELRGRLKNYKPFFAHVGPEKHTRFGFKKISLLKRDQWQDLHEEVFDAVSYHARLYATKLYIGPYYRPHVTYQKTGHLNPGDEFPCDSLYIVEKQGGQRRVVARLKLGNDEV